MTFLIAILAAITALLMVGKSFLELRTASIKYAIEKKANEDKKEMSSLRIESGTRVRSVWPHPVVLLLAVASFGLTFFAVWLSGPMTVSSIFLMVLFFLSIQLVFLHMAFNVAFRIAGDINGVMFDLVSNIHNIVSSMHDMVSNMSDHTDVLGDFASTQRELAGIVDKTLSIVGKNTSSPEQRGNDKPMNGSGGSVAS